MNENKIAEYRTQAGACAAKAQAATDELSKLFYQKLADDWRELVAKLESGYHRNW